VILDLIVEAKAEGLTTQQACQVIGLSPRTLQRWQIAAPASLIAPDAAVAPAVALPTSPQPKPIQSAVQPRASAYATQHAHAPSGSLRARPPVVGRASGVESRDPCRAQRGSRRAHIHSGGAIDNHLPDVSDYPCYTWAGPNIAPAIQATAFDKLTVAMLAVAPGGPLHRSDIRH